MERPWGKFDILAQNASKTVTVKLITINPNSRLSLQYHNKRSEDWTCLSGIATATIDGIETRLFQGNRIQIPIKVVHRLEASSGELGAQILEVAYGAFDEEDIVRIQDDYKRV